MHLECNFMRWRDGKLGATFTRQSSLIAFIIYTHLLIQEQSKTTNFFRGRENNRQRLL